MQLHRNMAIKIHLLVEWKEAQKEEDIGIHIAHSFCVTLDGNPFKYSCLENSMDRGACQDYSPWVLKELTKLSD